MQNQTDKKKENPLRLEKIRKQESLLEKGIELYTLALGKKIHGKRTFLAVRA